MIPLSIALFLAGTALTSAAPPNLPGDALRLVTAGGGITETVYALNSGDHLVGTDSSSVYPDDATKLPQIGYARQLSAEGLLSLNPDLVIVADDAGPDTVLEQVEKANVRVLKLPSGADVQTAKKRILAVGDALGQTEAAQGLIANLQKELTEAAKIAESESTPKVLFIYARGGGILNVSGTDTAANEMIELAGAQNAVTGYTGYKPLTAEAALEAAPDVILVTDRGLSEAGGIDHLLAHPGLSHTPAAKNQRVVAMDDLLLLGFGPRLGEAVRELATAIRTPPETCHLRLS